MARSKRSSGRYKSGAPFGQRFQQQLNAQKRDKELKKENPKKYKRQKEIAKASKDGKITQSEAKKLAKKGISLQQIQNHNISEYRQAKKDTATANRNMNRDRRTYDYKSPSFEPLKIATGAYEALSGRSRQPDQNNNNGGNSAPDQPTGFVPTPLPTDFVDQPVSVNPIIDEGPSAEDMFRDQIAEMEAGFAKSFQEQQAMFQQLQTEQNERMKLLQQQMKEQAMAQRERPQVAGVKTAQGSVGTALQIASRGVSGAFGRGGMRISSLNI